MLIHPSSFKSIYDLVVASLTINQNLKKNVTQSSNGNSDLGFGIDSLSLAGENIRGQGQVAVIHRTQDQLTQVLNLQWYQLGSLTILDQANQRLENVRLRLMGQVQRRRKPLDLGSCRAETSGQGRGGPRFGQETLSFSLSLGHRRAVGRQRGRAQQSRLGEEQHGEQAGRRSHEQWGFNVLDWKARCMVEWPGSKSK